MPLLTQSPLSRYSSHHFHTSTPPTSSEAKRPIEFDITGLTSQRNWLNLSLLFIVVARHFNMERKIHDGNKWLRSLFLFYAFKSFRFNFHILKADKLYCALTWMEPIFVFFPHLKILYLSSPLGGGCERREGSGEGISLSGCSQPLRQL